LTPEQSEKLVRGFINGAMFEAGLYARADDRADAVVQVAPPLTIGPKEFDEIERILREVLTKAWSLL
jgi:adenosylmethionine-8-amino-7-oxononanoate aminotransferase